MKINKTNLISGLAWFLIVLPLVNMSWGFHQVQYEGSILYYGAEPGKAVVHELGQWALFFLILVLSITPLKTATKINLLSIRRRLGLSVSFYAVMHLLAYLVLLLGMEWADLAADIEKRPYILIGFLALILLVPLTITSTKGWQRRLKKNWKRLHQLIYLVAILVLVHLWWQVKAGFSLAFFVTMVMLVIFFIRITPWLLARFKSSSNL